MMALQQIFYSQINLNCLTILFVLGWIIELKVDVLYQAMYKKPFNPCFPLTESFRIAKGGV